MKEEEESIADHNTTGLHKEITILFEQTLLLAE